MALSDMASALVLGTKLDDSLLDDVNNYDWTNVNSTPLNASGKFGQCADFTPGSSHSLEMANNSAWEVADNAWFCSLWVYLDTAGGYQTVIGQWSGPWLLELDLGVPTFYAGGGSFAQGSALSTGAWHLVIVAHDPVANVLKISVDGAAFSTRAHSGGLSTTSQKLRLGSYDGTNAYWLDGRCDDVCIGRGYVPTDADAAAVWASGAGVAFANWAGAPPVSESPGSAVSPATAQRAHVRSSLGGSIARASAPAAGQSTALGSSGSPAAAGAAGQALGLGASRAHAHSGAAGQRLGARAAMALASARAAAHRLAAGVAAAAAGASLPTAPGSPACGIGAFGGLSIRCQRGTAIHDIGGTAVRVQRSSQ